MAEINELFEEGTTRSRELAGQSASMVEAGNVLVEEHNKAINAMRARFAEKAPEDLDTALDPLEKELEQLGQSAAQRSQDLTTECQALEQSARQVVPVVEAISLWDELEGSGDLCACGPTAAVVPDLEAIFRFVDQTPSLREHAPRLQARIKAITSGAVAVRSQKDAHCSGG